MSIYVLRTWFSPFWHVVLWGKKTNVFSECSDRSSSAPAASRWTLSDYTSPAAIWRNWDVSTAKMVDFQPKTVGFPSMNGDDPLGFSAMEFNGIWKNPIKGPIIPYIYIDIRAYIYIYSVYIYIYLIESPRSYWYRPAVAISPWLIKSGLLGSQRTHAMQFHIAQPRIKDTVQHLELWCHGGWWKTMEKRPFVCLKMVTDWSLLISWGLFLSSKLRSFQTFLNGHGKWGTNHDQRMDLEVPWIFRQTKILSYYHVNNIS